MGIWLIRYALPRERRDKDAVLVGGIFLLVCAVMLLGFEVLLEEDLPAGGRVRPPMQV